MLNVVTFGYRWEGLALHKWAFTHTNLVAVVTPSNRQDDCVSGMIRTWIQSTTIPYLIHDPYNVQLLVEKLNELHPDLILCHCYTYKLPKEILDIPKYGCVNIHPGKLPKYKGRTPIEDALRTDDIRLWACLHYMDAGFDTGKIIVQRPVKRENDLQIMRSELTEAGLQLLEENWKKITK